MGKLTRDPGLSAIALSPSTRRYGDRLADDHLNSSQEVPGREDGCGEVFDGS